MKRLENWCVDCGLPCLGNRCPNRNVEVHYCDKCGCQLDLDDWRPDGEEEYCIDCLAEEEND